MSSDSQRRRTVRLSRIWLAMGVVALFAAPALTACPSGSTKCSRDADCESGQRCVDEQCQSSSTCKTSCQKDADCLNREECGPDNCCRPKTSGGKDCKSYRDCTDGQECRGTKCAACPETCASNLECTSPLRCEKGCCRVPPCKTDDDCKGSADGTHCDVSSGSCVSCTQEDHCKELEICKEYVCQKVECKEDRHCTDSKKPECSKGTNTCVAKTICRTHADCPDPRLNRCDPAANGGRGACKAGHCVMCQSDDECGGPKDFCVRPKAGLKDGPKCLIGCAAASECPTGFACSEHVISGFKVCAPINNWCVDPCKDKVCPDPKKYKCIDGICVKQPEPCDPCKENKDCGTGNECISLANGSFCGKLCKTKADCPTDRKYMCFQNPNTGSLQCMPESGECK